MNSFFIIGKNRSGTKWLSNIISNSEEVACIRDKRFNGICETNIFHHFPKMFGTIDSDENFLGFIELFCNTSFFKLMGLEKEVLYHLYNKKPRNYYDFFDKLMNIYCQKMKKKAWVQKTGCYKFFDLYKNFPKSKFVIIERNYLDNIKSNIALIIGRKNKCRINIIYEVISYISHKKILNVFRLRENVLVVKYEDLLNDKENEVKKFSVFLI